VRTIITLVPAFDAKALNCTDLLKSYIAGENTILTATDKSTEIDSIEIFDKTQGPVFFL